MRPDDALVVVHQEWNGWRRATVRLGDLEDVRWVEPGGAACPIIRARVRCGMLVSGQIPHDCGGRSGLHQLDVWILRRHTVPCVFEGLARRADDRLPESFSEPKEYGSSAGRR